MSTANGWTDERVVDLKRYAAAGFSASQIADQLGGLTRNAVIGKARRASIHITNYEEKRELGRLPEPRKRPQYAPDPTDPRQRYTCTIMDLADAACRWPLGEPAHDMLYCGAPTDGHNSYCGWHARIAYSPAGRRD